MNSGIPEDQRFLKPLLYPFWSRYITFNWKFGFSLVLVVCITRFLLVLKANQTGSYQLIGMVMFLSALVPFVFLNRFGRREIGIRGTTNYSGLLVAFVTGLAFSLVLYLIGRWLYGTSYENWYQYIGKSYNIPETITVEARRTMFFIFALTGMTFSPVGEEFFFRGVVHESIARSFGHRKASLADSLAFAITHLSHFGIVFVAGKWIFYPVSALIWFTAMFLVSILFFTMKKLTGSVWGAVLAHSGFNLGMIFCIFYFL